MIRTVEYRRVGHKFTSEMCDSLEQGEHLALIAPRNGGMNIALGLIAERAVEKKIRVSRVDCDPYSSSTESAAVQEFGRALGIHVEPEEDSPLAVVFEAAIIDALSRDQRPLWILVQDIIGFSQPIARQLLLAFQSLYGTGRKLAVVVSGSTDLIALTMSSLSPYRHATKYIVIGLDKPFAADFYAGRRLRQLGRASEGAAGVPIGDLIDADAFDYLFEQTNGAPHLLQEIIVSVTRVPESDKSALEQQWSLEATTAFVDSYVSRFMATDFFIRMALREAERHQVSFDCLVQLSEKHPDSVELPSVGPSTLEATGIVLRRTDGRGEFSCPVWARFVRQELSCRRRADILATQHRWQEAWNQYEALPSAYRDRPVSGDSRFRLKRVLLDFGSSLIRLSHQGTTKVIDQFFRGANHLAGFDTLALFDRHSRKLISGSAGLLDAPRIIEGLEASRQVREHLTISKDIWTDPTRLIVYSLYPDGATEYGTEPGLIMTRHRSGREIDSAEREPIVRLINEFWYAFGTAQRIEYRASVGDLREKHLNVLQETVEAFAKPNIDLGNLIQVVADSLTQTGGYLRVLICLVSPRGQRIQGVASAAAGGEWPIDWKTDFEIPTDISGPESVDIQPWVVATKTWRVETDAKVSLGGSPTTQCHEAAKIDMGAIAVVPMIVNENVVGTIHFERMDKEAPAAEEVELFLVLAQQIGTFIRHAQRHTLLERSLSVLSDQIRIVGPGRELLFANPAASSQHPLKPSPLWQEEEIMCLCRLGGRAAEMHDCLMDHARDNRTPIEIYDTDSHGQYRRVVMAPVDDFRADTVYPFAADGRIGYVEQVHDLTSIFEVNAALNEWLSSHQPHEVGRRILTFLKRHGYSWARLFLLKRSEHRRVLVSFEQFGIGDPAKIERFVAGRVSYPESAANSQPWHAIVEGREPAIYECDPSLNSEQIAIGAMYNGLRRFVTKELLDAEALEKTDVLWIEAPLYVGETPIGLLSLSLPDKVAPGRWEMLRIMISCASVALHRAVQMEEAKRRAGNEASKTSVEQVIHQLVHKINPVESWLTWAVADVKGAPSRAAGLLDRSRQVLAEARAILGDFHRFATNEPFNDETVLNVSELVEMIRGSLLLRHPNLQIATEGPSSECRVRVNQQAILDVFEIMAKDTLLHSGKNETDLRITLGHHDEERGFVVLGYKDNGVGIKPRLKESVFAPFVTTHAHGTGLGLTVARRYIERMGGYVEEVGTYRSGVHFRVELPIVE